MANIIQSGDKAPDFKMESTSGEEVSLSDFAGGKLVLYFYPKDDTPGCTKEAIAFTDHAAEFEAAGVKILGVSKDTLAKHEKFRAKHELGVHLASDADGATCEAYGVWVEKKMYGKVYMGIERATFLIGPDGKIEQVWRKVKVNGHAEAVLEAASA